MSDLTLILRTCDKVNAFSGHRPRDFGSKSEVMKKCIASIADSLKYFEDAGGTYTTIVVDDHSSPEMRSFITEKLGDVLLELDTPGNGSSFVKCVDLAIESNELAFLVEDDYLLKPECIKSMVDTYTKLKAQTRSELCIHPTDYPDRYTSPHPSYILLGSDRHYRTINQTTCTFMYHSNVFKQYKEYLYKFSAYGSDPTITEDNSINLVYQRVPCFSPIPSLAEHYQYKETLSPFFKEHHDT